MNPSNIRSAEEQPLRLTHPACYQHLLEQFATYHLHPYDVKASVTARNEGFVIILRYGEGLTQSKQQFFANEELALLSAELMQFYGEVAQLCQKTLIADYYKMIKP
jgi:hypothetical protein